MAAYKDVTVAMDTIRLHAQRATRNRTEVRTKALQCLRRPEPVINLIASLRVVAAFRGGYLDAYRSLPVMGATF